MKGDDEKDERQEGVIEYDEEWWERFRLAQDDKNKKYEGQKKMIEMAIMISKMQEGKR